MFTQARLRRGLQLPGMQTQRPGSSAIRASDWKIAASLFMLSSPFPSESGTRHAQPDDEPHPPSPSALRRQGSSLTLHRVPASRRIIVGARLQIEPGTRHARPDDEPHHPLRHPCAGRGPVTLHRLPTSRRIIVGARLQTEPGTRKARPDDKSHPPLRHPCAGRGPVTLHRVPTSRRIIVGARLQTEPGTRHARPDAEPHPPFTVSPAKAGVQ
jgi:hypothetical protein